MAFEDYQIAFRTMNGDEVLAVLFEYQRQCELEADRHQPARFPSPPLLSRESSLAEWELTCDADAVMERPTIINAICGSSFTPQEWKIITRAARRQTLGQFCDAIAPHTRMPRLAPVTVLGAESLAAGAFLMIRRLLADAGANASQIAPSTSIQPFCQAYSDVLSRLAYIAPGTMPTSRLDLTPARSALLILLGVAWLELIAGLMLRWPILALVSGCAIAMLFVALIISARFSSAARVRVGWIMTFGDLSCVMAGEAWGAWHGFPLDPSPHTADSQGLA
jgi:hypothetical protein